MSIINKLCGIVLSASLGLATGCVGNKPGYLAHQQLKQYIKNTSLYNPGYKNSMKIGVDIIKFFKNKDKNNKFTMIEVIQPDGVRIVYEDDNNDSNLDLVEVTKNSNITRYDIKIDQSVQSKKFQKEFDNYRKGFE